RQIQQFFPWWINWYIRYITLGILGFSSFPYSLFRSENWLEAVSIFESGKDHDIYFQYCHVFFGWCSRFMMGLIYHRSRISDLTENFFTSYPIC
ncbi:MAG: hypothetical protein P8Z41_12835, partial [Anaerolineales bacterium]